MQTKLTGLKDSPQAFSYSGLGLGAVEVLMGLGLTGRQARVYLTLLKVGYAKVQAVAGFSLVHRQEVYRLLDNLQQLGLVQRNVNAPTTFTPTPIAQGVKLLLEQKNSELNLMSQKAKQLTKKLSQNGTLTPAALTLTPCFGAVYESDRGKKYRQAIQEAQHTIQTVTSWTRFKQLTIHYETQMQNALKKGVTITIVTEKPQNHHLPKWVTTALSKTSNFKLKTRINVPDAAFTIFDKETIAIAFNPNISVTKGPDLWTNNPTLTALSQAYFNTAWIQTAK